MSITFCCYDAPRETVPCPYCKWAVDGGYDYDGKCEPAGHCTGTREEGTDPAVNFANVNAGTILRLLGLYNKDDGICGEVGVGDLGDFRQRIMRARNGDRSSALREGEDLPAGHSGTAVIDDDGISRIERRGPRTIMAGNTDEQTLRRLASLDTLASWAQEHRLAVSWG